MQCEAFAFFSCSMNSDFSGWFAEVKNEYLKEQHPEVKIYETDEEAYEAIMSVYHDEIKGLVDAANSAWNLGLTMSE